MKKIEMKKMVALFVLVLVGLTRANTVLLSDNFNGITATTSNTSENLAGRQSGTVAPVPYTAAGWSWYLVPNEGVSGTSALQCTVNGASSSLSPEVNWFSGTSTSLPDGGFTVSLDLNASSMSTGSTPPENAVKTVGVSFGGDSSWVAAPSVTASSFAATIDGNQWLHLYVGGNEVLSLGAPEFTLGEYHNVQLSYAGDSLADGTAAQLYLTVDGYAVDLNGSAAGNGYAFTMANYGDPSLNYLHLVTTKWACDFDNLEVGTGVVPEPVSLALLGLGAMMLRRRR